MQHKTLKIGDVTIRLEIEHGFLRSLGGVSIGRTELRNPAARFLPWFDTYEGDMFRDFRLRAIRRRGAETVLETTAVSDPDVLFRERRDCSGDVCLRDVPWDAAPIEAVFRIVLAPVRAEVDGRRFTGFRYWFEYEGQAPIHRLADRQTWEVGGNLDDVTICLRNWLTPPRMRIERGTTYSTVGLDKWAGLLPGNLWGRWSLLPAFDMQYGRAGVLLGWFDRVSCIRTVIESGAGEDALRCVDLHYFEQAKKVRTNPKTIVWCPDRLDETAALNLWTRVHDREQAKVWKQFGIRKDIPQPIVFSLNVWKDFHFDRTYEDTVQVASEFGGDYVFIDPVWENGETFRAELTKLLPAAKQPGTSIAKFQHANMCCSLDFEVARVLGGERALKALCARAARKGVKIMSWMAMHYMPYTHLAGSTEFGHGGNSIFAAKESGRHPDTGYPGHCWTVNLNAPIADKIRAQILGVCRRTGLAGFLWDSFSNLGWWQVDYSKGDLRPQFDRAGELFANLVNAGLFIQPEAITAFSNASCCGLHGGNVYAGDLLGYSYKTNIALQYAEKGEPDHTPQELKILKGERPLDLLFRCFAHKRVPNMGFHLVPRAQWHAGRVTELKALFAAYRAVRAGMVTRTVLPGDLGVRWQGGRGADTYFAFQPQPWGGTAVDVLTGARSRRGLLAANRVYRVWD